MRMVAVWLVSVFLAACDDASTREASTTKSSQLASANIIYLPDNVGVELAGRKVSDREVNSERGKFRRIAVAFEGFKAAEIDKSVATVLEAAGYKRKVREKDSGNLRVSYVKQGVPPVTARYQRVTKDGQKRERITLRLSWKID